MNRALPAESVIQHGLSLTLWLSIAALATAFAVGSLVGAVAGYWRGRWPDRALSWPHGRDDLDPFLLVIAGVLAVVGGPRQGVRGRGRDVGYTLRGLCRCRLPRHVEMATWPPRARVGCREWRILLLSVLPGCLDAAALFLIAYLPRSSRSRRGFRFSASECSHPAWHRQNDI